VLEQERRSSQGLRRFLSPTIRQATAGVQRKSSSRSATQTRALECFPLARYGVALTQNILIEFRRNMAQPALIPGPPVRIGGAIG
jgi:hypothetical protein